MNKNQIANIGDSVICVDARHHEAIHVTKGRAYEVIDVEVNVGVDYTDMFYFIRSDNGEAYWFNAECFVPARELNRADNKASTNAILKKVRCIREDEYDGLISVGVHYDVIKELVSTYLIICDDGDTLQVSKDYFTDDNLTCTAEDESIIAIEDNKHFDTNVRYSTEQCEEVDEYPSFKVNVLGQDYNVIFKPYDKDLVLTENLGYCDFYSKEIVVRANHPQSLLSNPNEDLIMLHTIRHEITHAFMFESGLDGSSEYARNEELIDWIAIQIPKMVNTMGDAVNKLDKLLGDSADEK